MENNPDFVSPIEKHWNEAAALRGSRSRNFITSSLELEPSGSGLLRRRGDLEDRENDGSGVSLRASDNRPSSSTGGTPKTRRSRLFESPHPASTASPAFEGRNTPISSEPSAAVPVCMAPPDVIPIYEQKQLFAAYSNRITPLQQHYHVNPTSFTTAEAATAGGGSSNSSSNPENTSATLHDQSTTTSTTSSFTSEAWSPILSARHARARSNSNSTRNSSVSTQQEATGSTARLSALGTPRTSSETLQRQASLVRRHEKPVLRIDCGKSGQQKVTRPPVTVHVNNGASGTLVRTTVSSRRPIIERVSPVTTQRMVPETPVIARQRKAGVHSPPNFGSAPDSRDVLRVFSNYNFSNINRKVFPLDVASDTASTISDEFFVPIKPSAKILTSRRTYKRVCRAEEKFDQSTYEVAENLRATKICSQEIADWVICKSCRQDQSCSITVRKGVRTLGRFVDSVESHETAEIEYDEIKQILVPPRRFKAVLSQQSFDYEAEFDSRDVIRAHESVTHLPALSDSKINLLQISSDERIVAASASDDDNEDLAFVREPMETAEINDECCGRSSEDEERHLAREMSWRNLVDIAQSERGCSHICDQNNEFNCALALQLFSLIDQLTEELKRVEADCVELRAELSDLRREKRDQENEELKLKHKDEKRTKKDANIYNLKPTVWSKEASNKSRYLTSSVSASLLQQELSNTQMPPELQHEVQIPIVLTNSEYRSRKTKKSIREKVLGLGILHRYSRHGSIDNFQLFNNSSSKANTNDQEPQKIVFTDLDDNFNEEFSIGPTSEPNYEEREEHTRSVVAPRRNTCVSDFGEARRDVVKRSWVVSYENRPTRLEDVDLNDSVDNSTRDPYNCIRGRRHPTCNSEAVPIPPRLSVVGSNTYQGAAFSGDRKEIIDKVLEGSDAFAASGMQTYSQQRICSSESRLTTIVDVKQMSMKALGSEVEDMHGSSDRMRVISHDWMKSFEENGEALFLEDESPRSNQTPESPATPATEQTDGAAPPQVLGVRHSADRRLPEVPVRRDSKLSEEGTTGRGSRFTREKIAAGLYQNWMSMKSTKPARSNPDTGADLKVRFDFDVKEQTFFKDEMPKKSNFKALTSPRLQFKSRLTKSFRKCASSIVGRMRDRGSHKLSHDYEDLDVLDERVNELAKQSEQLCRNLMETAQKNVQCPSQFNAYSHQNQPLDGASPQPASNTRASPTPSSASYIDLSSYGSYLKPDESCLNENPSTSAPKQDIETRVMFLETRTGVGQEGSRGQEEKPEIDLLLNNNDKNSSVSQENAEAAENMSESSKIDRKS